MEGSDKWKCCGEDVFESVEDVMSHVAGECKRLELRLSVLCCRPLRRWSTGDGGGFT